MCPLSYRYAMALYNQHVCPVDNWYVSSSYLCWSLYNQQNHALQSGRLSLSVSFPIFFLQSAISCVGLLVHLIIGSFLSQSCHKSFSIRSHKPKETAVNSHHRSKLWLNICYCYRFMLCYGVTYHFSQLWTCFGQAEVNLYQQRCYLMTQRFSDTSAHQP